MTGPALVADGNHARSDGLVSLGVVASAAVTALGFKLGDPLIGLIITIVILRVTTDTAPVAHGADATPATTDGHLRVSPSRCGGVRFHALRTRQAGRRAFISPHVLVPRAWTVQRGHEVAEQVEAALRQKLPYATVFTHFEPAEDRSSFADMALDREASA